MILLAAADDRWRYWRLLHTLTLSFCGLRLDLMAAPSYASLAFTLLAAHAGMPMLAVLMRDAFAA